MRRAINLLGLLVLVALAVGTYVAKTDAKADRRRAAEIETAIADEQEAIRVMRNEIGYLESPERLRALAAEKLGLEPIDPLRVVTMEDAPLLIEPAQPPVAGPSDIGVASYRAANER
jgi:cell division protein FtsL